MSVVPGDIETGQQPPMTIPLRHFLVGLGFLLLGGLVGVGTETGILVGGSTLAHVHLLLAGWVCVTIMGAMTQFVPVWSGVALYSRRLSAIQLWLVAAGLLGFAAGTLTGWLALLPLFGTLMLLGFWVFVYNVARTLRAVESFDVTERHFAIALGFFLLLTVLGLLLAVDLRWPVLDALPVTRANLVGAHATLAVFGAILTTVFGALYQLATMFTQSDLHGVDRPLRRFEAVGYPVGVVALAIARLADVRLLGVVGGLLIVATTVGFSVILARRLAEATVDWTPMLSRYAVVAPSMAAWAVLTAPAWVRDPLAPSVRFGAPGTVHLLTIGVVGFVVLGTLYHVVPFVVWVHRYSDLLGYEPVPMIDDLYSARVARADFVGFLVGGLLVVTADLVAVPDAVPVVGGVFVLAGTLLFLWNVVSLLRQHSPRSLLDILGAPTHSGPSSARSADEHDRP